MLKRLMVAGVVVGALVRVEAQTPPGKINVQWDVPTAVVGVTVSGYKVCYGVASGTYPSCDAVGNVTSTVLAVNDCTTYYVAVKALCATCAAGFQESATWSNEVVGWAQPRVTAVSPGTVTQGVATELVLTGMNFAPDAAVRVTTGASTVDATGVVVANCTSLKATVTLASNLPPTVMVKIGAADAAGKRVAGSASGLFQVTGPVRPGPVGGTRRGEVQ